MRTSAATDVPDLQLHLLPWSYVSPNQDEPIRHDVDPRTALTVLATLIYPQSRGTLRLASADPTAAPLIDFQYLAEPADLDVLAEGSEMVREIMAGAGVRRRGQGGDPPGPGAARGPELRDAILNRATSVYHGGRHLPDGRRRARRSSAPTCGSAASRGCGWPTPRSCRRSPAATPTRPAIMIGEKAADLVLDS